MNRWLRFVRFNAVGALGVGVQLTALWFLADVEHVHYLLATPVAVGLAVVHNFVWHWWWTWRDRVLSRSVAAAFVRYAAANGASSLAGSLGVMATLVSGAHLEPVAANAVAIGVCGLLNFWLGESVVFRSARPDNARPVWNRLMTHVNDRPGSSLSNNVPPGSRLGKSGSEANDSTSSCGLPVSTPLDVRTCLSG